MSKVLRITVFILVIIVSLTTILNFLNNKQIKLNVNEERQISKTLRSNIDDYLGSLLKCHENSNEILILLEQRYPVY